MFKLNDLELTEHMLRIREFHSLACGAVREDARRRIFENLAKIEDHARKAQWRLLVLEREHEQRQLASAGSMDKA